MSELLELLRHLPQWSIMLLCLLENTLLLLLVVTIGDVMLGYCHLRYYSAKQYSVAAITVLSNTLLTYAGFWLWKLDFIRLTSELSWWIISDTLLILMAMDLLMYLSHYLVHKIPLAYRAIHQLHHQATDPKPIDLFVLNPLETVGFAFLLFLVLILFTTSAYAVLLFVILNILFGMVGHLGKEFLTETVRQAPIIKYLGTETFHHDHHRHIDANYGFYTTIWDRLFRTGIR